MNPVFKEVTIYCLVQTVESSEYEITLLSERGTRACHRMSNPGYPSYRASAGVSKLLPQGALVPKNPK